jgi:hypothetical protein
MPLAGCVRMHHDDLPGDQIAERYAGVVNSTDARTMFEHDECPPIMPGYLRDDGSPGCVDIRSSIPYLNDIHSLSHQGQQQRKRHTADQGAHNTACAQFSKPRRRNSFTAAMRPQRPPWSRRYA